MPGEPLDPPEPRPSYSIYLLLHNILRLLAADDCEIATRTLPQATPPGGDQRRAMTTPYDYIPGGPVEAAPPGGYCPPEVRQEAFSAVLEDVEKGAYDYRIIAWLAQLDDTTCRTIASLMWRCRLAGAAPGSRMATADRDERDHATAAGEPGDCDDLIEDDGTCTCSTCGAWIGMFTGRAGWQHYRGRPLEIYDAGHEATPAPEQDGAAR